MVGMRDRLIHGYFGIDYEIVWDVVRNKVPVLHRAIQEIIETQISGGSWKRPNLRSGGSRLDYAQELSVGG